MSDLERRLRSYQRRAKWIRVVRKAGESIKGFVVGIGAHFVLIHREIGDYFLDGYVAIPLNSIKQVICLNAFTQNAVRHFKLAPQPQHSIKLDSVNEVLDSVQQSGHLLSIQTERTHPGQCYIGVQLLRDRSHVVLFEIDPEGKWGKSREYPLKEISQISFAGRYELALVILSGPPNLRQMSRALTDWHDYPPAPHYLAPLPRLVKPVPT